MTLLLNFSNDVLIIIDYCEKNVEVCGIIVLFYVQGKKSRVIFDIDISFVNIINTVGPFLSGDLILKWFFASIKFNAKGI